MAQFFIRWIKVGVWQALFEQVKGQDPALGMAFLDGTNIRTHHKAAEAAQKGDSEEAKMIVKHLVARVEVLTAKSA
ncbi:transposase [Gluconobacter cerinus NRIC 0229]|uniref:Transposase n=1 Tax=Gluconobacter cerinus TaxID=38307 RepID=A0AAV5NIY3_9PROT|nr:transposase [Gluconobacter cerinus NRIC 0229]GLQ64407.1 hypothetical protein GCM10007867_32570 [Gluconobacter cerinus]